MKRKRDGNLTHGRRRPRNLSYGTESVENLAHGTDIEVLGMEKKREKRMRNLTVLQRNCITLRMGTGNM